MTQKKITWSHTTKHMADLAPNGYNPRKLSETKRKQLLQSINTFGAVSPIILNTGTRENRIIGGEQRYKLYADLRYKTVDCMVPSRELSAGEERELNLRLNHNTGSWDEELLKAFDLDMLLDVGFGEGELHNFFDDVELAEDDSDPEEPDTTSTNTHTKEGEIWQLGEHRLLVGDSTDPTQVARLMDGAQAQFLYLDSPYNIGLSYNGGISKTKQYGGQHSAQKDSLSKPEYYTFLEASIQAAKTIAAPDAHFLYWCDAAYIGDIQQIYKTADITFRRICFWVKNNQNVTPQAAFNRVHEPALYGTIGEPYLNKEHKNYTEVLNQDVGTGNQLHEEILDMLDLWLVKRDDVQSYLHPTQKPVGLSEKPLRRCTAPGHIVFSGFGGSGSDLIACEQLKRKWYGVELDPVFASVIIDRWEKFTNQTAVRV